MTQTFEFNPPTKERYWLKQYRRQNGLTAAEVAKKCSITRGHYSMIENGHKEPSPALAKQISLTLGFDCTYFIQERFW